MSRVGIVTVSALIGVGVALSATHALHVIPLRSAQAEDTPASGDVDKLKLKVSQLETKVTQLEASIAASNESTRRAIDALRVESQAVEARQSALSAAQAYACDISVYERRVGRVENGAGHIELARLGSDREYVGSWVVPVAEDIRGYYRYFGPGHVRTYIDGPSFGLDVDASTTSGESNPNYGVVVRAFVVTRAR